MKVLMILGGLVILAVAIVDVFTSLVRTPLRAAPLSFVGETIAWKPLHALFRWTGKRTFVSAIGPSSVFMRAVVILCALIAGWSLVLFSDDAWVVHASSGEPAGFWERLYFVGYSISTLGLGDIVPGTDAARMATVGAALSGFMLITFVVGSISPLGDVIVAKNAIATLVNGFRDAVRDGDDPREALDALLDVINGPLADLSGTLETLPVRHRVFAERDHLSLAAALAGMERAIITLGFERDPRAAMARRAIDLILEGLVRAWLDDPDAKEGRDRRRLSRLKEFVKADRLHWADADLTGNPSIDHRGEPDPE